MWRPSLARAALRPEWLNSKRHNRLILLTGFRKVNKTSPPHEPCSTPRLARTGGQRRDRRRTAESELIETLRARPFEDLGFARVDHHRAIRQGFPEVVLGLGKTPAQIAAIAAEIVGRGSTLLVTRASQEAFDAVRAVVPDAAYYADARSSRSRRLSRPGNGEILIVAAGTSDLPVAEEAACTAELMGNQVARLYDVGVAGIHRLLGERARLEPRARHHRRRRHGRCAAERRLRPGRVPVIAVPTSVGYGASFGGIAALLGMLNSCASGVSVVNIDNGFGAADMASLINHL